MAKGQIRSNKEVRKPKADKTKKDAAPTASPSSKFATAAKDGEKSKK